MHFEEFKKSPFPAGPVAGERSGDEGEREVSGSQYDQEKVKVQLEWT